MSLLLYQHQDHLTTRTTTDNSGNVATQEGHYPYGESWYDTGAATGSVMRKFTSYTKDTEAASGMLNYAVFRQHSARIGRFLTADPERSTGRNAQALNRYSYVAGDPINLVDPRGRNFWHWLEAGYCNVYGPFGVMNLLEDTPVDDPAADQICDDDLEKLDNLASAEPNDCGVDPGPEVARLTKEPCNGKNVWTVHLDLAPVSPISDYYATVSASPSLNAQGRVSRDLRPYVLDVDIKPYSSGTITWTITYRCGGKRGPKLVFDQTVTCPPR